MSVCPEVNPVHTYGICPVNILFYAAPLMQMIQLFEFSFSSLFACSGSSSGNCSLFLHNFLLLSPDTFLHSLLPLSSYECTGGQTKQTKAPDREGVPCFAILMILMAHLRLLFQIFHTTDLGRHS